MNWTSSFVQCLCCPLIIFQKERKKKKYRNVVKINGLIKQLKAISDKNMESLFIIMINNPKTPLYGYPAASRPFHVGTR